ncbi:hypothetical protein JD844_029148 [Phrynosoma platyrhinos]|uniref:C-type lectin domain-containing protein n=1 Tax=Phrynosoma platyrhinos TaxID=52577 RepID=A0ABQ7SIS2_PHRPL|nr:hypothetical protein JD844_029148 [Phrynosoma platyrhinos]
MDRKVRDIDPSSTSFLPLSSELKDQDVSEGLLQPWPLGLPAHFHRWKWGNGSSFFHLRDPKALRKSYYAPSKNAQLSPSRAQCQRSGGHLASILDENEHEAVATYLQRAQRWDDEDVWIGLSIPNRSRAWSWVDGSPLAYSAWEKNKSYFALKGEHCALLDESSGFLLWDNDSCYDRNPFLCKV